jgi:hypothetical protein
MKITMRNYLLIGSVVLLFAAAGILYGGEPQRKVSKSRQSVSRSGEHTITTKNGKTIQVKVEGRSYTANLADGNYKLTNGGAIRVRGGKVVWDAFGAVKRLKTGRWKPSMLVDPTG